MLLTGCVHAVLLKVRHLLRKPSRHPGRRCSPCALQSKAGTVPRCQFLGQLPQVITAIDRAPAYLPVPKHSEYSVVLNPQKHTSQGRGGMSLL